MKRFILFIATGLFASGAEAQSNKTPIIVEEAPTVSFDPYYNYADQGNAMYINNSHFYNKDNIMTNSFPAGNGYYVQPGNSNPLNQDMYEGITPSGTIYSGYIPIRDYGNSSSGTSGNGR